MSTPYLTERELRELDALEAHRHPCDAYWKLSAMLREAMDALESIINAYDSVMLSEFETHNKREPHRTPERERARALLKAWKEQ